MKTWPTGTKVWVSEPGQAAYEALVVRHHEQHGMPYVEVKPKKARRRSVPVVYVKEA